MESVTISLFLLLAVIVSGWLSRLSPVSLPTPIVQIALGAVIALSTGAAVELQPDVFFLLFLPPLLFYDGWKIPKEGLFRDRGTILQLAVGLVVFTVLGLGLLIHWLIPLMPLAAAFALAAIVSPTDPVAVSAIAARVPIPKRLMHILEGEALLNDASGLVCMRFAVAAVVTGQFSLVHAVGTFAWLAVGGLAIGVAVTWAVTRLKAIIARRVGDDTGSQVLISLLIPFGAYLLAEELHCSGILAAVAAGITMSYTEMSGQIRGETRMRRNAVWDMIQFTANGIIFVLLGEQLPSIASRAVHVVQLTGHTDPLWLLAYVLAISLALIVLRFVWVWVALRFTLFRAIRRGEPVRRPSLRLIAATSLAGVRGAITLAGVLTIPFATATGTAFPARNLIIFLAAAVIVVSLLVASIGLPLLLKGLQLPPEPKALEEEDAARAAAAEAAIAAIEQLQQALKPGRKDAEIYAEAGGRIAEFYRRRIDSIDAHEQAADTLRQIEKVERDLRLAGLRAERQVFYERSRSRELPDDIANRLVREIDLLEARLTGK